MDMEKLCDKLVEWLKNYVKNAGASGAVFGMSGGVDSSVVSVLCKKAFGDNVLGLIMPCHSDKNDELDAKLVAEKFDIKYKVVTLDSVYDEFLKVVDETEDKLVKANIKPRLRMTTLYYYAGLNNYLVVGAENKSELVVGYFTKHGDSGADLMPIANLVKSQVRILASYLGIPQKIIDKAPSAGLWSGQTDESEMGITYEELDNYILTGKADPKIKERIELLNKRSEHKRSLAKKPEFILE
ncbi:NAD(+) synthase [Tepidanaerobacter syntrophicus]|uniref:NH(3)-dependent NAD(+) synthetase n=1 Tax=Tepidanaerobacter syntrophicus TaxID=224999 RepID=A0A0U9HHX2_9FIRM|nr:NAD(+) synthase [Tepidanaerobacter syntrophicus]GAQ26314.1 NAD+ synthase [Tepidanaerobacter syntrophicus]GLI19302.1 NH(3)-dependent NAD(+) synthetase [Tepidanaerobacter syntrophicus]